MNGASFRMRAGLFVAGAAGLYTYLRFVANGGYQFGFVPMGAPHFTFIDAGESRLMLLHSLILVPSIIAIGVGLSAPLAESVERRLSAYESYDSRQMRLMAVAFTGILFALYRVGRALCLRDLAITDDENGIEFGARILAAGEFLVPVLEPEGAFLELFLYTRDGMTTSMDWPGAVSFRALSIVTGLGDHLYALWAAIGGTAIVATAHRLFGKRLGLLAALVVLASPLMFGVNITEHAHVVSRTFVALAVWAYVIAVDEDTEAGAVVGLWLGAAAGGAFLSRPFESAALLGPAAIHLLVRSRGPRDGRRLTLLAAVGAFAGAVALFAYYNANTTGTAWLPPRFDHAHIDANFLPPSSFDARLSTHVQHNLLMLSVYFLGVLGLPIALLGALGGRSPSGVLAIGLLASLLIMFGHDNIGIHTVGPIHYSESVVPLTLLFVAGSDRLGQMLSGALSHTRTRAITFAYVVFAVGMLFTLPWLRNLSGHGEFVASPHEYLDSQGVENAIVISPQMAVMRTILDPGSWQLQMPHPDPYFEDDIVFALPNASPEELHARYPGRHIYRLVGSMGRGIMGLEHLHTPQNE